MTGAGWISTSRRFFLAEKRSRASGVERRRGDGLDEELGDLLGRLAVHRLVDADDAAERRNRVAFQRLLVGLEHRRAGGRAAGIGVLDDGYGRQVGVVGFSSCASSQQASRSTRLLKLSSLPCSCFAPATPRPEPSA